MAGLLRTIAVPPPHSIACRLQEAEATTKRVAWDTAAIQYKLALEVRELQERRLIEDLQSEENMALEQASPILAAPRPLERPLRSHSPCLLHAPSAKHYGAANIARRTRDTNHDTKRVRRIPNSAQPASKERCFQHTHER